MMEKSRGKQHIACPGVSGGAEGSRTPVRKHFDRTFSGRSPVSTFPPCADTGQTAQFSRVIVHGRGNSYPPHVRHINDAFPGLWPLRFRRLPLVRQRQQYDCCQLIFKLPVLWRSGAAARLSRLHTPVETGTPPRQYKLRPTHSRLTPRVRNASFVFPLPIEPTALGFDWIPGVRANCAALASVVRRKLAPLRCPSSSIRKRCAGL